MSDVGQVQDYGGRQERDDYYSSAASSRDRSDWNHNRHGWNRTDRWDRRGGYYRDRNLGGAVIGGLITGAIVGGVLNNSRPVYRERVYRGGECPRAVVL